MGDTIGRDEEPTPAEKRESALRMAIAGHPQGQVRRILLYAGLALSIGLAAGIGLPGLIITMPFFVLLMATDSLV